MSDDPYTRFYWRFIREYPEIWDDDHLFSWWMRLCVNAHVAHPLDAVVPRRCPKRVLARLIDDELVTLTPGDRYRIRGLDKELAARSDSARIGGLASGASRQRSRDDWSTNAQRTLTPVGQVMRELAELTGREVSGRATIATVTEDVKALGPERVITAVRAAKERANGTPVDASGLVFSAHRVLYPIPDAPTVAEERAELERQQFDRAVERTRQRTAEFLKQQEGA